MASKLERARASMGRLRQRVEGKEPLRALSSFGAGVAIGTLEQKGIVPVDVSGWPIKPTLATIAYIVAANSSVGTTTHAVFAGAGSGLLGAYGYNAGKTQSLIAGDDEDEDLSL